MNVVKKFLIVNHRIFQLRKMALYGNIGGKVLVQVGVALFKLIITVELLAEKLADFALLDMRKAYNKEDGIFTLKDLVAREPIGQFKVWFDEACKTDGIIEANGMCLSTATKNGVPSSRFVLLKGYGKEGFTFYTSYDSRKGKELNENPAASLCFYWEPLRRSIRIDGIAEKIPASDSDEYFRSRPKDSRIAACVSCSSAPVISSRDDILEKFQHFEKKIGDDSIPRPHNWGGYVVRPHKIEFWQGQTNRTHDRIVFRKKHDSEVLDPKLTHVGDEDWLIERFAP